MPRSVRKTALETRTARLANKIRRAPYFVKIAKGLHLGYYRGSASGSWIARRYRAAAGYETDAVGGADDTLAADGIKVLDFWQAQDAARTWAERQRLIEAGVVWCGAALTPCAMPSRTTSRKFAARSAQMPSKATKTCSMRSCCRSSVCSTATP